MASPTVKFLTIATPADVYSYLQHNSLFRGLPRDALEEVAGFCRVRRFRDRQLIHARGDLPDGMYSVIKGSIRATTSSDDGREALLALMDAGAWFGESSLFDGLPRAYDAHAQGDCELLFVPRNGIEDLLERRPQIYRNIVQLLCQRIRLSLILLETNALLPLEGRLANRLLLLSQDSGDQITPDLRLSQEDLSQMLGTTRQSINRVLKLWESQNIVERHYRGLRILDFSALRRRTSDS
ncbi:MAG: Crp/Fnr family transcriptional regulator [Pseudomonas sp.]